MKIFSTQYSMGLRKNVCIYLHNQTKIESRTLKSNHAVANSHKKFFNIVLN